MIRILYFASLRERVGRGQEELPHCDEVGTIADLRGLLRARGGVWSEALSEEQRVMAAVNQDLARPETPVRDGDEVAFFPPVTGG